MLEGDRVFGCCGNEDPLMITTTSQLVPWRKYTTEMVLNKRMHVVP